MALAAYRALLRQIHASTWHRWQSVASFALQKTPASLCLKALHTQPSIASLTCVPAAFEGDAKAIREMTVAASKAFKARGSSAQAASLPMQGVPDGQ